eukprot:TRINITY_DN25964_c0_g1_i1.p1 TRINITY_DN25964_c0_g1~~TRINITY_DN25964_c0_g1_i1.p1  ORF type:complete len:254 (+),score=53.94 TRINITY_DN25964_c0_g1_i1:86-847(+)
MAHRPDGTYELQMTPYDTVKRGFPTHGCHILASYTERAVLVYQAFNHNIADYAVANQRFLGCPHYNPTRMTWVKTNFLWMMYRCGFAKKDKNQERVLGIWVKRASFDDILSRASKKGGSIRIQWDPDYTPGLQKIGDRRAIQLGLKDRPTWASGEDIIRIEDVTHLAARCEMEGLIPMESVYTPEDPAIRANIRLTDLAGLGAGAPSPDDIERAPVEAEAEPVEAEPAGEASKNVSCEPEVGAAPSGEGVSGS